MFLIFNIDTCVAYITSNSSKLITGTFEQLLNKKGITRVQWIALYYLGLQSEINQKELADKMHIKESSAARLIDRMEREQLVIRERSKQDRRIIKLILTDKGMQYRQELLPEGQKFNDLVSKDITEEEMQTLLRVLSKMVTNVEAYPLE
ncbi:MULTISPECIES: MarR family winged helix-turn-helix transcriptional regulator [Paenibacillus]|uniref:MarR family winged helix-turn-helix transcriptional regulator n=1 Tax=Paenibacillus TaxID=44249 RepID=UPI001B86A929|nr:MarR family transcriptional regulator [Paenibacillus anaericanus]